MKAVAQDTPHASASGGAHSVVDGNASQGGGRTVQRAGVRLQQTGGVLQLVAALLWIPQAWLIAVAIGEMAGGHDIMPTAWRCAIGVLLLGLLRAGLDAAGTRLTFVQSRQALTRLRVQAVDALSRRSPLDISRPSSGEAASVLAEQAEAVVPYLARYRPVQLRVVVIPLVLLIVVGRVSWMVALVLMLAAPLIPFFMALVGWRARAASEEQMLEMGQMNGFLLDRLRGLTTIRAFGAVDLVARQLRASADELRRKTMVVLRVAFLSSAVLELFSALGVAMVAVYVGFHLLGQIPFGAWGHKLTLTQGLFVLLLAPAFFEPLRDLASVWHDRAAGVAALEALDGLRANGTRLCGGNVADVQDTSRCTGHGPLGIELQEVGFRYAGAPSDALRHVTLSIRPGEKVALVAPSGGGKSTLLALMAGLVKPTEGQVRLGGCVLDDDSADALRARMAWIGQQPHVFADTLAHNISLGRPGISLAGVDEAARMAALSTDKRERLGQPLGEGGGGLSGGEVLRLAVARAASTPGAGLLLADEPTAHLDATTAATVTAALFMLADRGMTLVVATHDERLLARMDRVVDLANVQPEAAA